MRFFSCININYPFKSNAYIIKLHVCYLTILLELKPTFCCFILYNFGCLWCSELTSECIFMLDQEMWYSVSYLSLTIKKVWMRFLCKNLVILSKIWYSSNQCGKPMRFHSQISSGGPSGNRSIFAPFCTNPTYFWAIFRAYSSA